MNISIIAVGKLKERYLKDAVAEYAKRLKRFCSLKIYEVLDERAPEGISLAQMKHIKSIEAQRIKKYIKSSAYVIILDLEGEQIDSLSFAKKLQKTMILGKSEIVFIIGGSLGLDEDLIKQADYKLCLSKLTFPHQLVRLILLEQVYRCFKIINNEPYHK